MREQYYPREKNRLRFQVEMAAGEYFGTFHSEGIDEQGIPLERALFVGAAKADPLLLWKVAEWWIKEGKNAIRP